MDYFIYQAANQFQFHLSWDIFLSQKFSVNVSGFVNVKDSMAPSEKSSICFTIIQDSITYMS